MHHLDIESRRYGCTKSASCTTESECF